MPGSRASEAGAVVDDLQGNIFARPEVLADARLGQPGRVHGLPPGGYLNDAVATTEGLGGVEHDVEEHLPDLRGVGQDSRQLRGQVEGEAGVVADGKAEQLGRFPHQAAQVQLAGFEPAAAGVGEELLAETGGRV